MLTINQILESFWAQMNKATVEGDLIDILSWIAQTDIELAVEHGTAIHEKFNVIYQFPALEMVTQIYIVNPQIVEKFAESDDKEFDTFACLRVAYFLDKIKKMTKEELIATKEKALPHDHSSCDVPFSLLWRIK